MDKTCQTCASPLRSDNASGYCGAHHETARRAGDPEAARARLAEYRARPEVKAQLKITRDARRADPDIRARKNAQNLASYHRNAEYFLAYHAARRLEHPEAYVPAETNRGAQRRARIAGAALVERIERAVVFERCEGICHICTEPVDPNDWHMDHLVPLVRGGDHTYDNIKVAHPVCNLRKGSRPT